MKEGKHLLMYDFKRREGQPKQFVVYTMNQKYMSFWKYLKA